MEPLQAFSTSYAAARLKFLEAAAEAGLRIESHPHPLLGRDGEALAMDVALCGSASASKLLVVSSACHGVEGYCGSAVQIASLNDGEWLATAARAHVAVLYIHALNPYGFSHVRRVTHENVDLNRNFSDFRQLPVNTAYRDLHALLLPQRWPPDADNAAAIARYIAQHGAAHYQAAISQGQHEFPDGLFYGGTAPTWSNQTLRQVLRTHARTARKMAWIDLHTGLGPSGLGERIFLCRDDAAALQRARDWWSGGGATPITSFFDGSSSSSRLTGLMSNAVYEECPEAQFTSIAMEYGTLPFAQVTEALRAEQWLNLHRDAPAEQAATIRQQMMDAFFVDTDAWKGQVISQARQAMFQAIDGLGSDHGAPPLAATS